jgi:hypothetical protein
VVTPSRRQKNPFEARGIRPPPQSILDEVVVGALAAQDETDIACDIDEEKVQPFE